MTTRPEPTLGADEREMPGLWEIAFDAFGETMTKRESIRDAWQRVVDRVLAAHSAALAAPAVVVSAEPVAVGALPTIPEDVLTYIHAYGDSRADDDGFSGIRIAETILAIRRWARTLATPVGPDAVDAQLRIAAEGLVAASNFKDSVAVTGGTRDRYAFAREKFYEALDEVITALASTKPSKGAA